MLTKALLILLTLCGAAEAQPVGAFVQGSSGPPPAVYALVASTQVPGSPNGGTSPAINTIGATLLVLLDTHLFAGRIPPTDSLGNIWTARICYGSTGNSETCLWDATNPVVGAAQTFSTGSTGDFNSSQIMAFSGVATVSPFEASTGIALTSSTTTVQSSTSVTPTTANNLVISSVGYNASGSPVASVNGGLVITNQTPAAVGVSFGSGSAYLFQSSAVAVNPTWTISVTASNAQTLTAVYK
jgi:hypothetical protein